MGRTKRRKIPITSTSHAVHSTMPKPQSTRSVIRAFHVLLKRKAMLDNQIKQTPGPTKPNTLLQQSKAIDKEITTLGGLEKYQEMSAVGQSAERGGGSEKVLIEWLKELGLHLHEDAKDTHATAKRFPLKLLEVGALLPTNYHKYSSWIHCSPIDLRSRHPLIQEQDFLLMDEEKNRGQWDIISLSLVINFVSSAKERGKMLRLAHTFLTHHATVDHVNSHRGLLFIALPLPCMQNSRYLTFDHFYGLMRAIGFSLLKERWRQGGKVVYWLFKKAQTPIPYNPKWSTKKVLQEGSNRNNFAIML